MKLKIGIIGTNFISSDFCEAAALIPEAELYAVCSRKQETGNRFAGKHGIPRVYKGYNIVKPVERCALRTPPALFLLV